MSAIGNTANINCKYRDVSCGSFSVICRKCASLSPDEADKIVDRREAVLNDTGRLYASRSPRPATRSSLYATRPVNPIGSPGKRPGARDRGTFGGTLGGPPETPRDPMPPITQRDADKLLSYLPDFERPGREFDEGLGGGEPTGSGFTGYYMRYPADVER